MKSNFQKFSIFEKFKLFLKFFNDLNFWKNKRLVKIPLWNMVSFDGGNESEDFGSWIWN